MTDWRTWTSARWNQVLVNAVFRDPNNVGRPIKRITATARFLAEVASANDSDAEFVKESFLKSFGSTATSVNKYFKWTGEKQKSLSTDCPSFFAQLYLTLLAGSADEKTFAEPDFRKRFSILMSHARVQRGYGFDCLAIMWFELARWSKQQGSEVCRLLVLPDPKGDSRIGYSKRLAFPTFIDERKLAEAIALLNGASDYQQVAKVVSRNINKFSKEFNEEFVVFNNFLAEGNLDGAFNTPFWGAIQDLTWDLEVFVAKKSGSYTLTIDMSDPNNPWVDLWGNDLGIQLLDDDCERSRLPPDSQGYKGIILRDGSRWNARELRGLAKRHNEFSKTSLGKSIINKELAFLPDDYGRLNTSGRYFDGCRVALILERERARGIHAACAKLSVPCHLTEKTFESEADATILIPTLSEYDLLHLISLTNDGLLRTLCTRRASAPITISGGSWFGQLLLMTPASSPIYKMSGASAGQYEFFDIDGNLLEQGSLEHVEGGGFRVPSIVLSILNDPYSLKLTFSTAVESKEKLINGRVLFREGPPRKLLNISTWRVDGPHLSLSEIDDQLLPTSLKELDANPTHEVLNVLSNIRFDLGSTCNVKVSDGSYFDIHPTIRWIWDALALRFQQLQTIGYQELLNIAESASIPFQLNPRHVIKTLTAAGWLVRLSSAAFRSDSYACGLNELVVNNKNGELNCRLLGPVSTSYWNQIHKHLNDTSRELAFCLNAPNRYSLGVVQLKFSRLEEVINFADAFQLPIVYRNLISDPLSSPDSLTLSKLDATDVIKRWGARYEKYELGEGWVDVSNHKKLLTGDLLRCADRKFREYLVFDADQYLVTNSDFLSRLLAISLKNEKIGTVNKEFDLTLNRRIANVPRTLSRWCMAMGTGAVAVDESGAITYFGLAQSGNSAWLDQWLHGYEDRECFHPASQRRNFALSLIKNKNFASIARNGVFANE